MTLANPNSGAIGCVCRTEEALNSALAALITEGVSPDDIRIGATELERVQAVAQRSGVRPDVFADDPLQGLVGSHEAGSPRAAIDRAGVRGGAIGALIGLGLSFTPAGAITPVTHAVQALADSLLFFVLGAIVGSVLGAAFAPQISTHVGFRLIDGMQEGGFAMIVQTARARFDEVQKILEATGCTGITRV